MSEETFKWLMMQGGFAALFAITATVCVYLVRHIRKLDEDFDKERAEWEKQRLLHFEARLAESTKVQLALESNTRALAALEVSSQARAAAVSAVSQLLSVLVEKTDSRDARYSQSMLRYDQRLEQIDRSLDGFKAMLENVQRSLEWGPRPPGARR